MSTVDLSKKPYYDSFDKTKNYVEVAAVADRPLQQREINELQSILNNKIKGVGNGVFKEGAIITGLGYDPVKSSDGKNVTINIHEGTIYIGGSILSVSAQSVTISATGDAYVYATYTDSIITANDDNTLFDPTSTTIQGADRLKATVSITTTPVDDTSVVMYHFQDGVLFIDSSTPLSDNIMKVLAQRTLETNGSYRVSGLGLSVDPSQTTDTNISVLIGDGVAYVRGYRVPKVAGTRVSIVPSTTTRQVINETQAYNDVKGYIELYQAPVKSVTSVTAPVMVTETVTRSATNSDQLKHSNVVAVKSISSPKGTVYGTLDNPATSTNKADVSIQGGNSVQWNSGSSVIPTTGGTYQVVYYYVKTMVSGSDYTLKTANVGGVIVTRVTFSGMSGDKPVNDARIATNLSVTYDFYLARRDLISLDPFGNPIVAQGTPDTIDKVSIPIANNDDLTLPLGWVTVYPNSKTAETNDYTVTNLTFSQLQKLQARVQTLEYNIATMAQDISAAQGHDPLSLRGVFSDGFNSYERADTDIFGELTTDDSGATVDTRWKENGSVVPMAAWSFDDAYITLPYANSLLMENTVNTMSQGTAPFTNPMAWNGHVITSPYQVVTEISQGIATGDMSVNPYMVYETQTGTLSLNPSGDVWQDINKVTVNNKIVKNLNVHRYWLHNGASKDSDSEFIYNNAQNINWTNTNTGWVTGSDWSSDAPDNLVKGTRGSGTAYGTTVTNGGEQTSISAIPYMRPITVTFTAKGLRRNDDNLYILFNGIKLKTLPLSPSVKGTLDSTIRADNMGVASGTFTIPSDQPTGTVDVFLKNDLDSGSSSNTTFTSTGTTKTIESIINTTFYQVKLVDPLAESFQFDGDRLLAGINLYFSQIDSSTNPADVIVQVRTISDGGTPTQKVVGQSSHNSTEIKVSNDSSVPTTFYFDNPVQLDSGSSYAVVVISNSPGYRLFYAQMGQNRLDNNQKLLSNPFDGVMFSSSNAQTWTAHQDSDLKFDLMTARFQDGAKSTILFDPVDLTMPDGSLPDVTVSSLLAALAPTATTVFWEYRVILSSDSSGSTIDDGTHPWYPISSDGEYDPQSTVRVIQIRATIQASKYISPRLTMNAININALVTGTKGTYVGKNVYMGDTGYNTVHVSYSQYLPDGTSVIPKFLMWSSNNAMPSTWETLDSLKTSHSATVTSSVGQPDVYGYSTVTHVINLPTSFAGALGFDTFKMRLDLSSTNQFIRPNVKSLKAVLTDE